MSKGIDRATPITAKEAMTLAQHGYTFIGRYYSDHSWKRLTKTEARAIKAAGMYIVTVFENANNHVKYFGFVAGTAHARSALSQAKAIGQPPHTPIYFAVDFDARRESDFVSIAAYFDAILKAFDDSCYDVGIYGSYGAIQEIVRRVKGIKYQWQTVAWSKHQRLPSAHLYQSKCDTPLPEYPAFGKVDLLESGGAGGGFKIT